MKEEEDETTKRKYDGLPYSIGAMKIALNAAKLPKFKAINRKSWSPRTIVVIDLCLRARLM